MFHGVDGVDTGTFVCPQCHGQLFFLFDVGGNGVLQKIQMRCVVDHVVLERAVLPALIEELNAVGELQGPPQAAQNQLWCDRVGLQRTQATPDGVCRGLQFRVLERGNELLSACARCGKGDSLGMINPAVG